jgi:hypothetical protein
LSEIHVAARSPGRGFYVQRSLHPVSWQCFLYRRHDRLKVFLYESLRSGDCSPQLEQPHITPGRLTRPGDICVPVGDNGLGVAYAVTVISPLLGPILASTARTSSGHAVSAAEQRKPSLHTSVCAAVDIRFVPLAQETFGLWSGMASHQMFLIANRQGDRTGAPRSLCRSALFRVLSVATQRSIAREIIDRSRQLPEHATLLPACPS